LEAEEAEEEELAHFQRQYPQTGQGLLVEAALEASVAGQEEQTVVE